MSTMQELSFKDVSFIRSALEGYIGLIKLDLASDDIDDDARLDLQEDIIYYERLLHLFRKSEKQSFDLREVQGIGIPMREDK
jgi:hypothetical protein